MKKFLAVILIIISAFLFLLFLIILIVAVGTDDVSADFVGIGTVILFIPALLLLLGGKKLIRSNNEGTSANRHPVYQNQAEANNYFERFNNFDKDTMIDTVVTKKTVTSSDNVNFGNDQLNEMVGSFFGSVEQPVKGPVSADCPGCGAKVTVQQSKSGKCDYCGTVVRG